jgi:molybdate transport system substrate-binding protein
MRLRPLFVALLALLAGLAGCGRRTDSESNRVEVYCAASTQDAVRELADTFSQEQGIAVVVSAGDSSRLATQIAHEAPADLFLSAAQEWADYLRKNGEVAESVSLLGNQMVLIVPRGNPAAISKPADLTGRAVQRVAVAGPTVPAGMYARQALGKLGLWKRLEEQGTILSGENVRTVLAYIERGEAEAGIVYATDARITEKVETVYRFPDKSHELIRYPLMLLRHGARNEMARRLYNFLRSPRAAKVFRQHGFTWLAEGKTP